MDSKGLAWILWLSYCFVIVLSASRQFTGNGYMEYKIASKPLSDIINSDEDQLLLDFRTVQPSGLLFHARSSGGVYSDFITLEVVGGRLRYAVRYGRRINEDDAHKVYLGKNLDDGESHSVKVRHYNRNTTIYLDFETSDREEHIIITNYGRLDIDTAIYVGGAPDFSSLLSVRSNASFMGCMTNVVFEQLSQDPAKTKEIDFLKRGVADTYPSSMTRECLKEDYQPFTFSEVDSSFVCPVRGLSTANSLTGSFMFRTYKDSGMLLKQENGNNKFELSYMKEYIELKVTIVNSNPQIRSHRFDQGYTAMNSGNWHQVRFILSPSTFSLTVGDKTDSRAPTAQLPSNFFKNDVTAGGFIGCMMKLSINNEDCKPNAGSQINKVEWSGCNITDFCIFSPCLHNGNCEQTGKTFSCNCATNGYNAGNKTLSVCQFPDYVSTCKILKERHPNIKDGEHPLDFDGPGPLKNLRVYCNFTANPVTTRVISKDIGVKLTPSSSPISRRISYEPSLEAAEALARHSKWCYQYINFGCKNVKLLTGDKNEKLGFWVSADGVYQNYWGGATPGTKSCACGDKTPNVCVDKNKKCNCDAGQDKWNSDEGYLNSTTLLPVEEVVFKGVAPGGEANFTVGHLYCAGDIGNTATFVNEDGFIKLKKWSPPSDGVISLFFKTSHKKGTLLYNGIIDRDFFQLKILNESSVGLLYNIGNGVKSIALNLPNKQVSDQSWHRVVIYRNMKVFGLKLDDQEAMHANPLFLKRDLDLQNELYVGGYPFDVTKGFVGCIRGLEINGEVQDLSQLAGEADYVESGCGAACKNHSCKNRAKCLDNYNVYACDCSKTPFYGYFCHQDRGASFNRQDSELIYTYPEALSVSSIDIVVGFKVGDGKPCSGDIIRINSKDTPQFFRLSLNSVSKKLEFRFQGEGGSGFIPIDPPPGQDFCKENHTFALSRRYKEINYTVDGVKGEKEEQRLDGLFSLMEKITIGKQGDGGFKGCITGVKVTRQGIADDPETVEPIKAFVYDGKTNGFTATGISPDSKEKCAPEPDVPEIPTPRPVGRGSDLSTRLSSTPDPGQRAEDDNKTAIIVVVVLILVLLLVVLAIVIYWYWARHKGEYHTHEDDEDLKSTDPYIDLSTPRKPQGEEVEKKKEWFI